MKVALCIYHMSIHNEDNWNFRCVYIMCQSTRKRFKVAVCIYHMLINKEEDLKLRCVYIIYMYVNPHGRSLKVVASIHQVSINKEEVFKLRCEYIICQSWRQNFSSCGVYKYMPWTLHEWITRMFKLYIILFEIEKLNYIWLGKFQPCDVHV